MVFLGCRLEYSDLSDSSVLRVFINSVQRYLLVAMSPVPEYMSLSHVADMCHVRVLSHLTSRRWLRTDILTDLCSDTG